MAKRRAAAVSSTVAGNSAGQLLEDRAVVDDALAEVTLRQLTDVDEVLLVQRLVEAHLGPDLLAQLRRRVLAEQGRHRVAGQQVNEGEHDDGQAEQDRDRPE